MRRSKALPVESLSDRCTECERLVHPSQIARLDSASARCPHCGQVYRYATHLRLETAPPVAS